MIWHTNLVHPVAEIASELMAAQLAPVLLTLLLPFEVPSALPVHVMVVTATLVKGGPSLQVPRRV